MNTIRLMRYGMLGIPLAFVGLPLYVHIPRFYADARHVDLERLGLVLLVLRMFDTVLDPLIGMASDRLRAHRRVIMVSCLPFLAGAYYLLFNPPQISPSGALFWLGCCLTVVYLAFSTLMINYYAMGVDMGRGYDDNTRISAWREGAMLLGVLLASLLPTLLSSRFGLMQSYRLFGLALVPLLFFCAWGALSAMPSTCRVQAPGMWKSLSGLLKNRLVRWALIVALFNAIPTAITATLFLFFTSDLLHAGEQSGPMLAAYFLSAACAMPLWTFISARSGKRAGLLMAMFTAVVCFIWAYALRSGDIAAFYVICILSGMTLGADSALLPSLFADVLAGNRDAGATAFGLWNVTGKLTMALAAGIALPVLAHEGYRSGAPNSAAALHALAFSYALLPCMFKAAAIGLLYLSPLDRGMKGANP